MPHPTEVPVLQLFNELNSMLDMDTDPENSKEDWLFLPVHSWMDNHRVAAIEAWAKLYSLMETAISFSEATFLDRTIPIYLKLVKSMPYP